MYPLLKNVWTGLKECRNWLYWGANRHCGVGLLPRFQGIPSYHRPVGEYLGFLPIGPVRLTRVTYRSASMEVGFSINITGGPVESHVGEYICDYHA